MSVVTGWHSESGILNQGWGLLYKRIYGLKVLNIMENILRLQFSVQIYTDSNTNNDYNFPCSYRPPLYISMICVWFSSILHYYPWFQRLTFVVMSADVTCHKVRVHIWHSHCHYQTQTQLKCSVKENSQRTNWNIWT